MWLKWEVICFKFPARTAENMFLLHQTYVKPLPCYHRAARMWKVNLLHPFPFWSSMFHSGSDFPKGVTDSPCQSVVQRTLGAVVAQRQPSCVWAHGSIVFVMLWGGVLISFTIVQWARHCAKGCLILYLKNVETCGLTMSDCTHILFVWYACHTSTSHQSLQHPGPSMQWRINTQCLMSLRS